MVVGNGKNTSFWHDKWCGQVSLKDKFPQLYEINLEQNCSVSFNKQRSWRLSFRRWLHEELHTQLRRLWISCIATILMMAVIEQDGTGKNLGTSLSNLLTRSCVDMSMGLISNKFGML